MTPFGKEIRKLRIDADITMSEMAKGLGKLPSYLSAVEIGDKPLSDEFAKAMIGYLRELPYFRKHRLDEGHLFRLADRTRRTVNVQALQDRDREVVAAFARRLPSMSADKRANVNKKLEEWLSDKEE